jgi:hypothetical protein
MPRQGVDAEVLNEDPRQWQTKEKFDRIICKPRLGLRKDHTEVFGYEGRQLKLEYFSRSHNFQGIGIRPELHRWVG